MFGYWECGVNEDVFTSTINHFLYRKLLRRLRAYTYNSMPPRPLRVPAIVDVHFTRTEWIIPDSLRHFLIMSYLYILDPE